MKNDEKRLVFILEDIGNMERVEIDKAESDLSYIFDKMNDEIDIVVFGPSGRKNEIYNYGIENDLLLDFVPITKLRSSEFDTSIYNNKTIIVDNFFNGTTSEFNNTYKNMRKLVHLSKNFYGIQCIGDNYLHFRYFFNTLGLMNVHEKYDDDIDIKKFNMYLKKYFTLISNGEEIEISKNYWDDSYGAVTYNSNIKFNLSEKIILDNKKDISKYYENKPNNFKRFLSYISDLFKK